MMPVDLICLDVSSSMNAAAQFGLITLAYRQEAPALRILREQLPRWVAAFPARFTLAQE